MVKKLALKHVRMFLHGDPGGEFSRGPTCISVIVCMYETLSIHVLVGSPDHCQKAIHCLGSLLGNERQQLFENQFDSDVMHELDSLLQLYEDVMQMQQLYELDILLLKDDQNGPRRMMFGQFTKHCLVTPLNKYSFKFMTLPSEDCRINKKLLDKVMPEDCELLKFTTLTSEICRIKELLSSTDYLDSEKYSENLKNKADSLSNTYEVDKSLMKYWLHCKNQVCMISNTLANRGWKWFT